MKSYEIRQKFIEYFESKAHTQVASSSLIPDGDTTLIFTNAGMFQFKNTFLGVEKRDYTRAVSSQKCVRAGGKHNDLENVGYTARHHTFFEMLGNFSFGDYFKKEAIHFAWDFLTNVLKIDKDKLYVTVFREDDEAEEIWHKVEGLPKDRIYRFDEKDNFWKMGDTGPCGPCTEIFYDHQPEKGQCKSKEDFIKGSDEDRFIEIWNLVFMQFYEEPKGVLSPLPKPSVDTGAGLERIAALMQGTNNNYECDLFLDYIKKLEEWSGKSTKEKDNLVAMRVLADHTRCISFLLSDGVLPSNDGRGYVLRRILRRAVRYSQKLSSESLISKLAMAVIEKMGEVYPNLIQQKELILHTIKSEEERFLKTLDQGTSVLNAELKVAKNKVLSGDVAFKLYDTYGFPLDLTQLIARENGFSVDELGFEEAMNQAKDLARKTWKGSVIASDAAHLLQLSQTYGATEFSGYQTTSGSAKVLALSDGKSEIKTLSTGQTAYMIVDTCPFYAEGGGQVGDRGSFEGKGFSGKVSNTTKNGKTFLLHIELLEGELKIRDSLSLLVDESERRLTAANHSATHLLHAALRTVLGKHVTQAGSLVDSEKLRFDFTHDKSLTIDEISKIEFLVNKEISLSRSVTSSLKPYDKAISDGALALFGEKYESDVRVIQMGNFSHELCGGTHVENTSQIRLFKIVSESGVSTGVRRIEALTSDLAQKYLFKSFSESQELRKDLGIKESWTQYLEKENNLSESLAATNKLKEEIKRLDKELKLLQLSQIPYGEIVKQAKESGGIKIIVYSAEIEDRKLLTEVAERFRDLSNSAIIVVLGRAESNYPVLVCITKDLKAKYPAGNILKKLSENFGGKGGGRPDFAQGALEKLGDVEKVVNSCL